MMVGVDQDSLSTVFLLQSYKEVQLAISSSYLQGSIHINGNSYFSCFSFVEDSFFSIHSDYSLPSPNSSEFSPTYSKLLFHEGAGNAGHDPLRFLLLFFGSLLYYILLKHPIYP